MAWQLYSNKVNTRRFRWPPIRVDDEKDALQFRKHENIRDRVCVFIISSSIFIKGFRLALFDVTDPSQCCPSPDPETNANLREC